MADDGRIDGFPVTWLGIEEGLSAGVSTDRAPFAEYQRAQWGGPAGKSLDMRCVLQSSTHASDAKNLARLIDVSSPHLVFDPAGTHFDDGYTYVHVRSTRARRAKALTYLNLDAEVLGTPWTHSLSVVATAKQIQNDWLQAGAVAVRLPSEAPQYSSEVVDDAFRQVALNPAAFTEIEAAYVSGLTVRNALTPIEVANAPADSAALPFGKTVRAFTSTGLQVHGSGRNLAGADQPTSGYVENSVLRLRFIGGEGVIRFNDLSQSNPDLNLLFGSSYAQALHGGVTMPATPQRQVVAISNGAKVTVMDNGNVLFDPGVAPPSITFLTSTVRALGTGVFYQAMTNGWYVVGTRDFAVSAGGVLTHQAGAVYGFVRTASVGSALTARLRECLVEVLPSWYLQRRTR